MSGFFITFEGVEGAGKTTQILLLKDRLTANGHTVFATRCPGGEPVAEAIRSVLLHATGPVNAGCELLLFTAARAQVTSQIIRPHLELGEVVIMDRFLDSTVAYQGHARNQDLEAVRAMNLFATAGLLPDITILLDTDPSIGLARQMDRNRMEDESIEFHQRVRTGYLAEAERDSDRLKVIDANRTVEEVHEDIWQAVNSALAIR